MLFSFMAYVPYRQGLSFSPEWNNTQLQGATVLHKATDICTGKWQTETSHTEQSRLVKSTRLLHLLHFGISGIAVLALLLALLSFSFPPQRFLPHTVTLSLSHSLCYSACLISRSLIGWLPAPREIPLSLPPTRPPTQPSARKCEQS